MKREHSHRRSVGTGAIGAVRVLGVMMWVGLGWIGGGVGLRAADPVVFEVTALGDGLSPDLAEPGQPGVYRPMPGSLRWAVEQAHLVGGDVPVVIRLVQGGEHRIGRSTVWDGVTTEGVAGLDASHGDIDIRRSLTIEGRGGTIDAQGLGRVLDVRGAVDVVVEDVTLRGGGHWAMGSEGVLDGGGAIRVTGGAKLYLRDVVLEDNEIAGGGTGERRGGAILVIGNAGGRLDVRGGRFENNRVRSVFANQPVAGGAIWQDSGTLFVMGTTYSRCWVMQDSGGAIGSCEARGGAISLLGGSANLMDTVFEENSARSARGGEVSGLVVDGHAAEGGAVDVRSGVTALTVLRGEFRRNTAKSGRGGGTLVPVVTEGRTGGKARGGGVHIGAGAGSTVVLFQECVMRENLAYAGTGGAGTMEGGMGGAAEGGAVYAGRGEVEMRDTAFLANRAVGGDGGVTLETQLGAKGGVGGDARGGAVCASSQVERVLVKGRLVPPSVGGGVMEATVIIEGNLALGGGGRPGRGNEGADGRGGGAMGGALAIWASVLEVDQVMGLNNSAQGGSGANAAGDPQTFIIMDPPPAPPMLGRGGDNGAGFGGFLATHAAVAEVEDSTLAMNRAVGGRLVGRVHHLVGPENGGVWWLGEPDVVVPFVAGGGGLLPTMAGASGGSGGTGGGGAVYGGAGRLEIRGSALAINEALGGNGGMGAPGSGGSTGQRRGGDGGRGGDAAGAAVCLSAGMTFRIETTLMQGNLTMAGRGGAGGRGGDATGKDRVSSSGGTGGFGGQGGNAFGGALYSPVSVVDAAADARISGTYAAWNKVVAGDGFYGGNGGMGAGNEGGFGAIGGHGGQAKGGALHVMSLHLERSTLDRNLVSGGWGGASGHGSAGNRWGGWGSVGGSGGVARGGGLSILAGAGAGAGVRVDRSTVSGNRVVSGFGGQGGAGGTGNLGGGGGGWGGLNGEAAGGGVHNDAGANALVVVDSTIAWNRLDTGDGGHAGLRGFHAGGFSYLTVPTRYQAGMPAMVVLNGLLQPGPAIRHGAASELVDATGYQLGTPSPGPDGVPYVQAGTIGDPGFQLLANPADMTDEQKAEAFAGAFASGGATSAVALAAGVGWVALKAYLVGSTLFSGPTAVTTGLSLGVAGFGFSGIAAGGAVLSIGVVVGVKFLAAGISSGDWEGAAAFALGSPGDVTRFNLGVLLTGVGPRASDQLDDEIVPQPGSAGVAGGYVPPTGPGIQGGATLARSLVSNNTAERRVRPPGAQKLVNNVLVVEYTEQRLAVSGLPEVSGTAISQGGNLIGAASGFPVQAGDQVGTPGAPLDARVDVEVGDHGGGVPTLKLLPGSPARGAVLQVGGAGTAQNGYIWPAGTMRDIGAWGALPNRPPVVTSRNHRIIQGSGDRVNIHGQDLLDAQTDPDGDTTLGFSLAETVPGDGEWLVWGLAGAPLGILSHQFTPDPGFLGYKELFRFRVTDGELESGTGVLTLQTVAPPDPESCPLPGSGTVVLINDQPSTAAVAARVELPDESRVDHGFTGPFTVEFWMNLFRPGGVWAHEHEALITKGDGSWRVQRAGNTSRLAFDITGLTPLSLHSAREIGAGWHHVAAVFDGTRKYLFIDGELDAWADISGVPAVNDEPVWIGANSERLARTFQGAFDEVRIWNRARTPAEIRAYATRSLTGHEPGLLTYYRFDEPAGEVVLNLGMTGTAEPGRAIRQDPDRAPERYSFGISRAATPVLWEYGTTVLGRHLFYNDSVHDGRTPGADPGDDGAIALGKSALLPGGVATAMNVSSYSKGLNGVMIDVARLRFPGAITAADFVFTRGSAGALDTWEAALPPAEVVVRPGEGVCGSSRVTLVWDARGSGTGHEAVGQGWLGVRMLANSRTGLLHDEVFHFGSAIGESDDPDAITSAQDALRTLQGVTVSAGIDHALDHNRDGLVSAADALVVLNHVWTGFHRLDLRTPSWVTALPPWNPVSPSSLMGGAVATAGVHDVAELPPFVVSVERPAVGRLRLGAWIPPGRTVRAFAAGGLAGPWEEVAGIEVVPGEDGVSVVELPVPDGQSAGFYRLE